MTTRFPSAPRRACSVPRSRPATAVEYQLSPDRHAYLVPAVGSVDVNGVRIDARDGAAIANETVLKVKALEDTEVVLVDAA